LTVARIRSIKPEFFEDPGLQLGVSLEAQYIYPRLWQEADARGLLRCEPEVLWAKCFALRFSKTQDPRHSLEAVRGYLRELESPGADGRAHLIRYEVAGKAYLAIPSFGDHQVLDLRDEWAKLTTRIDEGFACPEPPAGILVRWWQELIEKARPLARQPRANRRTTGGATPDNRRTAVGAPVSQQGGQQGGQHRSESEQGAGKRSREQGEDTSTSAKADDPPLAPGKAVPPPPSPPGAVPPGTDTKPPAPPPAKEGAERLSPPKDLDPPAPPATTGGSPPATSGAPPGPDALRDAQNAILDAWVEFAQEFGLAGKDGCSLTKARAKALGARLREKGWAERFHQTLDWIREHRPPFLLGIEKDWSCTIEFLLTSDGVTKVLEGNYKSAGPVVKPKVGDLEENAKRTYARLLEMEAAGQLPGGAKGAPKLTEREGNDRGDA
jgi:hypothetical protein